MVKKKFKSTVLCCAFHPTNGQLLATGCADFKMRIYSTFATDVDGSAVDAGPFANSHGPLEFGEVYVELSALGWIHAVAWSPSGNILAYTGQCQSFSSSFSYFFVQNIFSDLLYGAHKVVFCVYVLVLLHF